VIQRSHPELALDWSYPSKLVIICQSRTWQSLCRPNSAVLHKVSHAMQSYSAPMLSSLTEFGLSCHSIFLQSCPRSLCHSVKDSNHGIHLIRDERASPPSMLSNIPKFGASGSFVSFLSFSISHFLFVSVLVTNHRECCLVSDATNQSSNVYRHAPGVGAGRAKSRLKSLSFPGTRGTETIHCFQACHYWPSRQETRHCAFLIA
jgi:hypothetical protein